MRARAAMALALVLAVPMALSAAAPSGQRLEGHAAASARVELQVSLLLDRLLAASPGAPGSGPPGAAPPPASGPPGGDPGSDPPASPGAPGTSPPSDGSGDPAAPGSGGGSGPPPPPGTSPPPAGAPPSSSPSPAPTGPGSAPSAPPPRDPTVGGGSAVMEVHFLTGAHAWSRWMPPGVETEVDLDGDRAAELAVTVDAATAPTLTVQVLRGLAGGWGVFVKQGAGRWGLTGSDAPPGLVKVEYRGGDLAVEAQGEAAPSWQVAFMVAEGGRRSVAWQGEPTGVRAFEAQVGEAYRLVVRDAGPGVSRFLVMDGDHTHDLTLRDTQEGASVLQDAAHGFRYAAPLEAGGLAYRGDAAALGQRGRVSFTVPFLPTSLSVAARDAGFLVRADRPTDLFFDWQPPSGEGLQVHGRKVTELLVTPEEDGGLGLLGQGLVRVARPGGASPATGGAQGTYVDLDHGHRIVVGKASGASATVLVAGIGAAMTVWVARSGKRGPAQRQQP